MEKVLKKQKGITLIALVLTIIVMLILAGVTINLTLGENGIFTTAEKAAKNYMEAQEEEVSKLYGFETLMNDTIKGTYVLNGTWSSNNKVNKPKLSGTGLTPVTLNTNGSFGIPNIEEDSWYSYDGKTNKWANARSKDGSLWVWIPRFAYKITYTNVDDKSAGGTIDIVFLQGTSDNYYDENGELKTAKRVISMDKKVDTTTEYTVHPAFTNESGINYANGGWDKEIPGFWIAKFEAGYVGKADNPNSAIDSNIKYTSTYSYDGTSYASYKYNYYGERLVGTKIKYPTFQANRPSMNYISIADAYDLCRSIQNAKDVYGLTNIDSHMTKNSEWGAIAYLTHSKYGRNGEEVVLNNVSLNNSTNSLYSVTGYAAISTSTGTTTTTWDKIETGEQAGSWLTEQGQTASTTGNICGIYDLAGGVWEWTAGYLVTEGYDYKTYAGNLKGDSTKYKTKYAGTTSSSNTNYSEEEKINRIGDAIVETSSNGNSNDKAWNKDYSFFPNSGEPFFRRGGIFSSKAYSGTFVFGRFARIFRI